MMSAVLMLIMISRMRWSINFVLKEFQWKTKGKLKSEKVGSQNQTKAIQEASFFLDFSQPETSDIEGDDWIR